MTVRPNKTETLAILHHLRDMRPGLSHNATLLMARRESALRRTAGLPVLTKADKVTIRDLVTSIPVPSRFA